MVFQKCKNDPVEPERSPARRCSFYGGSRNQSGRYGGTKKYKVAMRLYRVGCDTGIIHWSGGPFVSPGYVFINYNGTRNIFPYGTTADKFDTVGDFLEYQKENVKIYHSLVEDGIINENMFILPINGYLFTEAIMVYENEEDERDNIEYETFQLNAVFCPLTKN
ncbi:MULTISPECIES: hypothetical protein [unclassified Pantoea]